MSTEKKMPNTAAATGDHRQPPHPSPQQGGEQVLHRRPQGDQVHDQEMIPLLTQPTTPPIRPMAPCLGQEHHRMSVT